MAARSAVVFGASGITGRAVAHELVVNGWRVSGVSRSAGAGGGAAPVPVDLFDAAATRRAVGATAASHAFYCTWTRRSSEAENIAANTAMLRSALEGAAAGGKLEHVCLVTGLKHYLGPFEAYGKGQVHRPPFREDQPRLPYDNFYYEQEDVLLAAAAAHGFTWSVHRPHTVIGYAVGNAMNMGVTLAVYGTLCKEYALPFVFPGSPEQHSATTDVTDARLLARQLVWAATAPSAADQAFNTVNGDTFRWVDLWPVLAAALAVPVADYPGRPTPLEPAMHDAPGLWRRLARARGLAVDDVHRLASWWHTDADLGRTVPAYADMAKSRALGFHDRQDSAASFLDLFRALRDDRLIPDPAG